MAAADGEGGKMITLISSERERFQVSEAAASLSKTVANMIEDGCADDGVPLINVSSAVLAKVLEYCNQHATKASDEAEKLESFDAKFIDVDRTTLFDLILAANYMNIPCLLNLACQKGADLIKDKTTEEIREIFGIENDFTPEEEAEIRRENPWAFEI
uniref:SKP1-like protein n=1 Tax=Leersia perrieri TaxID=77586 RepID=A0A0D9VAX0_9ORYZ